MPFAKSVHKAKAKMDVSALINQNGYLVIYWLGPAYGSITHVMDILANDWRD